MCCIFTKNRSCFHEKLGRYDACNVHGRLLYRVINGLIAKTTSLREEIIFAMVSVIKFRIYANGVDKQNQNNSLKVYVSSEESAYDVYAKVLLAGKHVNTAELG